MRKRAESRTPIKRIAWLQQFGQLAKSVKAEKDKLKSGKDGHLTVRPLRGHC
jgi:hypothetical protein